MIIKKHKFKKYINQKNTKKKKLFVEKSGFHCENSAAFILSRNGNLFSWFCVCGWNVFVDFRALP